MSALDELAVQCERRGWRVSLDGRYPDGRLENGFEITALEVHTRQRELLASVSASAGDLDLAAVEAAHSLERQGLIK